MKSFICDECNQVLLIEMESTRLSVTLNGYRVCTVCQTNIEMSDTKKFIEKNNRNKELKQSQLSLNIICEAQVKTVNNTVVTQLSMF